MWFVIGGMNHFHKLLTGFRSVWGIIYNSWMTRLKVLIESDIRLVIQYFIKLTQVHYNLFLQNQCFYNVSTTWITFTCFLNRSDKMIHAYIFDSSSSNFIRNKSLVGIQPNYAIDFCLYSGPNLKTDEEFPYISQQLAVYVPDLRSDRLSMLWCIILWWSLMLS